MGLHSANYFFKKYIFTRIQHIADSRYLIPVVKDINSEPKVLRKSNAYSYQFLSVIHPFHSNPSFPYDWYQG